MTEQDNSTPPLDEESLRLLEELEGDAQPSEREQLEARALELSVKFPANIGDAKLRQRVEEAEAQIAAAATGTETETPAAKVVPDPDPVTETKKTIDDVKFPTLTNVSKNHRSICRVELAVGESHTLDAMDMADDRLMAKITRALELGVLESD